MAGALGVWMEASSQPGLDADRVLWALAQLTAAAVPDAPACAELTLIGTALSGTSHYPSVELELRQAIARIQVLIGADPDQERFDVDTPEQRTTAVFLCLLRWCLDGDTLDAELAVEHIEDLLMQQGEARASVAARLTQLIESTPALR
jgi:hypothetical protein